MATAKCAVGHSAEARQLAYADVKRRLQPLLLGACAWRRMGS